MSNENHNNQDWKQKLADMDNLPAGMRMNKDIAWGKLHQRLKEKPRRKMIAPYWAAAACLVPLIVILSLLFHQDKNNMVSNAVRKQTITKREIKITEPVQKDILVTIAGKPVEKRKGERKKRQDNAIVADINKEQDNDKKDDSVINNQTITAVIPADSATAIVSLPAQRKNKLKVIHINELGEPVQSSAEMAHNTYWRSFPLQIAREEIYSDPLKGIRKTSFISLQTKSSSN